MLAAGIGGPIAGYAAILHIIAHSLTKSSLFFSGGAIVQAFGTRRLHHLRGLVRAVPLPTWGRDELRAGEIWNSNSVVSWVLTRAGVDAASLQPPAGGRASGWAAGVAVARRSAPAPIELAPAVE